MRYLIKKEADGLVGEKIQIAYSDRRARGGQ